MSPTTRSSGLTSTCPTRLPCLFHRPPFTLDELDPAGIIPEEPYTKEQLQNYLAHGRNKCRVTLAALSEESTVQRCGFKWLDITVAELMLYNLRHVQHHVAQLNLLLRQNTGSAPHWVAQAREQP